MRHSINTELLQKLLNYLSSRPFNEVNGFIKEVLADVQQIQDGSVQQTQPEEKTAEN